MLYIVSTPIGNLGDITFRAVETLKKAELIAAEDTRRTAILLNHYKIKNKMLSYHDHNKERMIPRLIGLLKKGQNIALVSDSGTPGISDPGYALINEAIANNIIVSPIPGPNAAISAIVASGHPTDNFRFYGFLPKKEKKKAQTLESIGRSTGIFYESPHRIEKTLGLLAKIMPDAKVCIAREMTKKFEEFLRGKPKDILKKISIKKLKGEIVIIINQG